MILISPLDSAMHLFNNWSLVIFRFIFPCKLSANFYACDVNGTLCIDWLRGTILGGKAISSMKGLREGYLKRERKVLYASGHELLT